MDVYAKVKELIEMVVNLGLAVQEQNKSIAKVVTGFGDHARRIAALEASQLPGSSGGQGGDSVAVAFKGKKTDAPEA